MRMYSSGGFNRSLIDNLQFTIYDVTHCTYGDDVVHIPYVTKKYFFGSYTPIYGLCNSIIYIGKIHNGIYYWSKNNYIQSLLATSLQFFIHDQKLFRLRSGCVTRKYFLSCLQVKTMRSYVAILFYLQHELVVSDVPLEIRL